MDASSALAPAVEAEAAEELESTKPSAEPISNQKPISGPSDRIRSFTDSALKFLSNASNETLGACVVGLCASTYLLLGRVGLVLIGIVAGIVLHATWEGSTDDGNGAQSRQEKSAYRRKELGVEVAKRVLDWRDKRKDSEQETEDEAAKVEASVTTKPLDYSDFKQATGAALTTLTDAIVRDYVKCVQPKVLCAIKDTDRRQVVVWPNPTLRENLPTCV
jgi:hypothetical protein